MSVEWRDPMWLQLQLLRFVVNNSPRYVALVSGGNTTNVRNAYISQTFNVFHVHWQLSVFNIFMMMMAIP